MFFLKETFHSHCRLIGLHRSCIKFALTDLGWDHCRVPKDGLEVKEFFEPGLTPLPTVARMVVGSKTTAKVAPRAIDVNVA